MIKAVLFDFDGTLINTNDLIYESHNYAFKKVFNREITQKEFLSLYGRPLKEALNENFSSYGDKLLEEYMVFNEKNHDLLVKKFPGVSEGIALLKENGIKIGVVTSKRLETLNKGIAFLKFENMFDCLITPLDSTKHKPDPEPIIVGCQKINISEKNTVYVGDSVFDMQAAYLAGVKKCFVNYSLTSKDEIKRYNPEFFCDSICEFAENILKKK